MNDFSELEAELKALRPTAASPELHTRIERAMHTNLAATPTGGILPRRASRVNWFALGLGLAAAATFLLLARVKLEQASKPNEQKIATSQPAVSETAAARTFVPDGVTRVVYNTSDEGLVFPVNATEPARRVRSRARETLQWKDPGNGASLRVSYPTEDVELIPVSLSVQ